MLQGKKIAALAAVCAMSAGLTVNVYGADSTFEMRRKAVSLLGILTTSSYQENVTREEFARMLVNASEYHQTAWRACACSRL